VPTFDLFLPLTKVDIDARMVHGVATAEAPDRSGEICDYASTKPYFETWSMDAHQASGGKSLGAVRAMHSRIAAGKLTDIAFDDEGKRILVAAKIVDEDEWQKVVEGVYTGFSQGGRYVKRWNDPDTGMTRYTADPTEISLVDVPCLPGATFEVVKDGFVEKRAFAAPRAATKQESPAPAAAPPPPPQAPQGSSSQALAKAGGAGGGAGAQIGEGGRGELEPARRSRLGDAADRGADQARRRDRGAAAAGARGAARGLARMGWRSAAFGWRRRCGDQGAERSAGEGAHDGADEGKLGQSERGAFLTRTAV
jgi:hypothetical protein